MGLKDLFRRAVCKYPDLKAASKCSKCPIVGTCRIYNNSARGESGCDSDSGSDGGGDGGD